jgi:hypothetical protein
MKALVQDHGYVPYMRSSRGHGANVQFEYFNKRRVLEMRQKATVDAAAKARDENIANRGR